MNARHDVKAFLHARRLERAHLLGRPLLPGESIPAACDFAVACHGGRDAAGAFDWLSAYLPYADANGVVLEAFAPLLATKPLPLLAALCAADPFREQEQLLLEIRAKGFLGVCNYPAVGLMDGSFRTIVEQQGLGFEREVQLIHTARRLDLYTLALVFSAQEAAMMLDAGADALLLHPGLIFCDAPLPVSPADAYPRELAALAGALPDDCLLFAACLKPEQEESMARSLLPVSGFYAVAGA